MIAGARNFAFVSPAHATLQEITRFADLSAFRQAVIPYPNTFFVKPKKVTEGQKAKLLYVGRLDPSKGLRMLLSAASVARRTVLFELDVLGTGSLEKELRQAYQQCDWVKFHGNVPQESVAEFMSRSTVLLVPSQWLENAPLVIMHALFAGLPVLGSSIGGIPEYVDDGRTGRLLPPDDELAWSTEIARVVADPTQLANWSAACPEFARQFDPKVALDAYEKLIEAIVSDLDRASA
jgi:glycosyltransferase involved in cell wall biosynthesis